MRKYASLRWRLTALIACASVVTAVIAAAGYAWIDLNHFRQQSYSRVEAVGKVVSGQVGPAMALGDRKAAGGTLAFLRSDGSVVDAFLFNAARACFATYRRSGMIYGEHAGCGADSPDGGSNSVKVSLPVMTGAERRGTLALISGV